VPKGRRDSSAAASGLRTQRLLRRLALTLLIATAGLSAGVLSWPWLRARYHLARLHRDHTATRIDAMNRLAGIAIHDENVAGPLLEALLAEAQAAESGGVPAVDRIAVWSLQRAGAVRERADRLLASGDDGAFRTLAGWLHEAGHWTPAERTLPQRARWATLRLRNTDPQVRKAALESLQEIGPAAAASLRQALATVVAADPDVSVRRLAATTVAACLQPGEASAILASVLAAAATKSAGQHPTVRREAALLLGLLSATPAGQPLAIDIPDDDPDPAVRAALLWAGRGSAAADRRARAALGDPEPQVRRLAVWILGFVSADDRAFAADLVDLLPDEDPVVRARAAIALGRRVTHLEKLSALIELSTGGTREGRLAALYALGRCARDDPTRQVAVQHLRETLEQALRSGDSPLAAAATESLGRLADTPYLPVFLDITDAFDEQPMLQYAAANAATAIEPANAADAWLPLCASPTDELRELAAFRISRLPDPPQAELTAAVLDEQAPLSGGAALALGLAGVCGWPNDPPLAALLAPRLDPASDQFETAWQVRANYLCAGLLCGDAGARRELDVYLLNAHVSRVGLFLTLLHTGDPAPGDALLSPGATIDAASFLCDARFADVLACYLPGVPLPLWQEDEAIRRFQVDLLRLWWRVFRHRLTFDPAGRRFVLPGRDA